MKRVAFVGLILWLAGCQPLPHPFERDGVAPTAEALQLPAAAGVALSPVAGMPGDAGAVVARTMAATLDDADIPAALGAGNRASLKLTGEATSVGTITWTLSGPKGEKLGTEVEAGAVPPAEWQAGAGPVLDPLTRDTASRLATLIAGPEIAAAAPATPEKSAPSRASIVVKVEAPPAAPGDGSQTLSTAMRRALVAQGYRVADTAATVIVRGEVAVSTDGPHQHVRIVWHVLRRSGEQQAELAQENDIASGALDRGWGPIAADIVAAALPDLVPIIDAVAAE